MLNQRNQKLILAGIIVILLLIMRIQCKRSQVEGVSLADHKKQLALADSLYQDTRGVYTKLVEDFKKTRQLNKELKEKNEDLYKSVKDGKGETVLTQFIELEPVTITDTIFIAGNTVRDTIKYFEGFRAFYPSEEESFVTYSIDKRGDILTGSWSFDTISLDLAIVEQERGIFYVKTDTPEWLKVRSVDVQSLPLSGMKKNNFDFVLGAGIGRSIDPDINSILFKGEAGFRVKKSIFMVEGNSTGDAYISYKKLF